MKLDEEALKSMIDELETRFQPLFDVISTRRAHAHNLDAANPELPPRYANKSTYQTDIVRRTHVELKGRLTQNPYLIDVAPARDVQDQRDAANRLQDVMLAGLSNIEDREGINILSSLADGLSLYCYGVLHWSKADDIWPAVPRSEGEADDIYRDRRNQTHAVAGFPWYVEVVQPDDFMFVRDRSLANGLGLCVVRKTIGLLDYFAQKDITAAAASQVSKVPLYAEEEAPRDDGPSMGTWKKTITLYQVWTRDEFYELKKDGQVLSIEKAGPHPYGMAPFAIAAANEINESDIVLRYEPAMQGLYRVKPFYDRIMAYYHVIAEMIALPYYYLRNTGSGESLVSEDGNIVTLSRDAALSQKIPDGYTLEQLPFELNPAFVQAVKFMADDLQAAAPQTGQAEVSTSTQPWALRLQQEQANVEPQRYLQNIARAIRTMARNMAKVMSMPVNEGGFGEDVATFSVLNKGQRKKQVTVSIKPEEILSLDIDVSINAMSTAEQITLEEHGRQMLDDPNVQMTLEEFVRDYQRIPDSTDVVAAREAYAVWNQFVKPQTIQQLLAALGLNTYVFGPEGQIIGPNGQPASPAQVLQSNGQQPTPPPPTNVPQPPNEVAQTGEPPLPPLTTPNTIALAGRPG